VAVLEFELRAILLLGRISILEPLHQSFFVLGILKMGFQEKKIVYSPSHGDFRSRANTAMWLDLGHNEKERGCTGDIGIGRKPKT
jgi:hypothetical protein